MVIVHIRPRASIASTACLSRGDCVGYSSVVAQIADENSFGSRHLCIVGAFVDDVESVGDDRTMRREEVGWNQSHSTR